MGTHALTCNGFSIQGWNVKKSPLREESGLKRGEKFLLPKVRPDFYQKPTYGELPMLNTSKDI